jgi:hypothetical protein
MNEDMKTKLNDIESRWKDNMHSVCSQCMYSAIRHWDRNEECYNDDKKALHPDRYDGELYAEAGADIKCLLEIIKKLKENN